MKAFGHETAKRTIVFSNSPMIKALDTGSLKRKQLQSDVSTTDQYESRDGRKRFQGNGNLKGTQYFGSVCQQDFGASPEKNLNQRDYQKVTGHSLFPNCPSLRLYPWPYVGKLLDMATGERQRTNVPPEVSQLLKDLFPPLKQ